MEQKNKNRFFRYKPILKIRDFLGEHSFYEHKNEAFTGEHKKYSNWGIILTVGFCLILFVRLFLLQVQDGFLNLKLAEGNRLRSIPMPAPRGVIVDDKGNSLVQNDPIYQLVSQSKNTKDINKLDPKVFEIIGMSKDEVIKAVQDNSGNGENLVLKDKIPRDDALLLKSRLATYAGFEVFPSFVRRYPDINLSHLLGYVGKSSVDDFADNPILSVNGLSGKSGIEKTYDEYLQGVPGYKKAEVDVNGRVMRLISTVDPLSGDTVKTSIDSDLQNFVAQTLEAKLKESNTTGTAIVMDPRNGAIKAMVSYPYYDNSKLSSGISKDEFDKIINDKSMPLLNRAIAGTFPPGSSIKPFLATAALAANVVTSSFSFDTPPFIQVGQWKFPDWKDHGVTDIKTAIAQSNNVFFFALGGGFGPIKQGLGPDGIKKGLELFGYGSKTKVDLTGEASGFIPTPAWKKQTTGESWFIGNTYNMSIGQGDLLVTPLQIANATCSIANGGKLFSPRVVSDVVDANGNRAAGFNADNLIKSGIYSNDYLQTVQGGMRQTLLPGGSANTVFGNNFPIAVSGKTGTAQYGNEGKTHAWFTSYAPSDDPKIEVTVLIEGGGEGYATAAPVAKDIYSWWSENRAKS